MLSEYGVHDESMLVLKVGTLMKIFVETQSGETQELEVLPSDTIASVKEQIFQIRGIEVTEQQLFFDDKILDNEKTLRDYRVSNLSTLELKLG